MVTWEVLAEYSWIPTTTQSGSFLYTAASSTPIRVVTREIWYTHELSLTLEHSMPVSSPAVPGLTQVQLGKCPGSILPHPSENKDRVNKLCTNTWVQRA